MRLVIDLQGAQGSSRHRGIGRYCLSLVQGLARNSGEHEIFVALNGLFPSTIEPIRAALDGLIPRSNVLVWQAPAPVRAEDRQNDPRRHAAELLREAVLASVSPDYVLVSSMFEGLGDDVVTSLAKTNCNVPTAAVLYDLIPLIYRDIYLPNPVVEKWYENKLGHCRKANLLLAISDSARLETVAHLEADSATVVNISSAAEEHFSPVIVDFATRNRIAQTYSLTKPFVMYTGGNDHRKNIERLIAAFARLPAGVRRDHQLAVVCSFQDTERRRLQQLATDAGLTATDLILTGFVPEDDLLACYRMCKLFVFPSWHEGFGLPALEAMKCGRAVIASNTSSLPEVIGADDALFDPFDTDTMSRKIFEVLTDDHMRARLERHGLEQARKFSWDNTARRAWEALEASHARLIEEKNVRQAAMPTRRPRLAFLSPLPPEPSGISDYSAELLPELARYYRIEVISAQDAITDPWVLGNCEVRSVEWFRRHAHAYDRILYHFGNSTFHSHMFELLRDHPGVVVLHDFFLSGIVAYRDASGISPNEWPGALLDAHGWPAIIDRFKAENPDDVMWTYPCNLQVLQDALGIVVHGEHSRQLARRWYGEHAATDWRVISLQRRQIAMPDREAARRQFDIAADDFLVCSFGLLDQTKMNLRLIEAWLASPLAADPKCHLIFVGQNGESEYCAAIKRAICAAQSSGRIEITGREDMTTFRRWLVAADLAVQLRTLSRGETSAAVLDCMNFGIPTIVNANGSLADLPQDALMRLADDFTEEELVAALVSLRHDKARRDTMGRRARTHVEHHHQSRRCAAAYAEAIEQFYDRAAIGEYGLGQALHETDIALSGSDWIGLADDMAKSLPVLPRLRRLLVDVSDLVQGGSSFGIRRIVRSILHHWLHEPPAGWIVEPVYAEPGKAGYRYARQFTCRFLDISDGWCDDDQVEPRSGDAFIGLDLQRDTVPEQRTILHQWRRFGVTVKFVIYDLLPVTRPEFFPPGDSRVHPRWLETVSEFDGVICVSRAVADEFHFWLEHHGPTRALPLAIDWFHLGADMANVVPTYGKPATAPGILATLRSFPSFLSVGTIEPRKGQRQLLAAFDILWRDGSTANLIFVGKLGWMMDDFGREMRKHPHLGTRFFWLEDVTDEYLDLIYAASSYLIAASEGEGFGLPLIEASRHGLPVLARDIPVFHEVAGDAAIYFEDSNDPKVITNAVAALLQANAISTKSHTFQWLSWAESANELAALILQQHIPYSQWHSGGNRDSNARNNRAPRKKAD